MLITRRAVMQFLGAGLPLSRVAAEVTPDLVRFTPEIEPIVRLIEDTPREECARMLAEQLRRDVPQRQLMAALFLAGVRNVNPRPPGFALHCVFVIHSAHVLSLEAPADCRLLPLFFALDDFKASQERDRRSASGDYVMRSLQGSLPSASRAESELISALEAWDGERAERAAAALARGRSLDEAFRVLWGYGARDYRNIGHKAIYVANAYRTLKTIGSEHAEPVLRSLVLSLVDFGRDQQVNGYAFEDQTYLSNVKLAKDTKPGSGGNTQALVDLMRSTSPSEICSHVANERPAAEILWDAVHLAAAELVMRARGGLIVPLHAVTSANALHYAYMTAQDPETRFLLLLQAGGWMGQFRTWAAARPDSLREFRITDTQPPVDIAFVPDALRNTVAKADEVHYYKYSAALVEDTRLVSPKWKPYLLSALMYYIKRDSDGVPAPMQRAREALQVPRPSADAGRGSSPSSDRDSLRRSNS